MRWSCVRDGGKLVSVLKTSQNLQRRELIALRKVTGAYGPSFGLGCGEAGSTIS